VPDYLRTTNGGAMSMCWFFKVTAWTTWPRRRAVADETRAVNGGTIGLADRTARRFDAVVAELLNRGA
jgi:predicted chitinase